MPSGAVDDQIVSVVASDREAVTPTRGGEHRSRKAHHSRPNVPSGQRWGLLLRVHIEWVDGCQRRPTVPLLSGSFGFNSRKYSTLCVPRVRGNVRPQWIRE